MNVVTISLYWGFLPEDAWETEKAAVYRDGKVKNANLACSWHLKLCGFQYEYYGRKKLIKMLDNEELYVTEKGGHNMICWLIRRDQYNSRLKRIDEIQAAINDKNDPPMEFITKYLNKLTSMGYTVTSAPSAVTADATTVWTLSKSQTKESHCY